jgi:hypothetical protein
MSDDSYFDLPEDRNLAFLQIERELRATLKQRLDTGEENSPWFEWYQDYANSVLGAVEALSVDGFEHLSVPANRNNYHDEYRNIVLAVDRFTLGIRVAHAQLRKQFSVALDGAAKEKIRHYLGQLKQIVDTLDVSQRKREAIISKLIALEEELERDRTRFEIVGAFIIDAATIAGQAGEQLEPWRRWVDSALRVFGLAKDEEQVSPGLPPPRRPKRIEPPKSAPPKLDRPSFGRSDKTDDIDDDIPF